MKPRQRCPNIPNCENTPVIIAVLLLFIFRGQVKQYPLSTELNLNSVDWIRCLALVSHDSSCIQYLHNEVVSSSILKQRWSSFPPIKCSSQNVFKRSLYDVAHQTMFTWLGSRNSSLTSLETQLSSLQFGLVPCIQFSSSSVLKCWILGTVAVQERTEILSQLAECQKSPVDMLHFEVAEPQVPTFLRHIGHTIITSQRMQQKFCKVSHNHWTQ